MNERQIAELIFDKFRSSKCKAGEIVPMRVIRFSLIMNLNPKEKELFDIVFVGLQITGYFTYFLRQSARHLMTVLRSFPTILCGSISILH